MHQFFPRSRKIVIYVTSVLVIMGAFTIGLDAQVSTGTVRGMVRDTSGAALPGAALVLSNLATGVETKTTSTGTGSYLLLDVQPGQYVLQASKDGFATKKTEAFVLQVNQTATLDLALIPGSTSTIIEVHAEAEQLQTATAETGNVITGKEITDLPLNSRNFTNLLLTAPGVSAANVAQTWTTAIGTYVLPSVNGAENRSNLFILDGVLDSETFGNSYAIPPAIDTIQEMKLQAHNDSAEFGGSMGSIVNVVTKAGTNNFHGDVYEYIQNDRFNANNAFNYGQPKQEFNQNQFGGTVGGPVLIPKLYNGRNKMFFFFGYDGYRYRTPNLDYMELPTAAERNGDFSARPNPIYDPATTTVAADGSYVRTQFPGNIIPKDRLNAGNLYYVNQLVPVGAPTDIIPGANFLDTTESLENQGSFSGRLDVNFGSADSAFFRISTVNLTSSSGPKFNPSSSFLTGYQYSANLVHVFSPTSILQIAGGVTTTRRPSTVTIPNLPNGFLQTTGITPDLSANFYQVGTLIPGAFTDNWGVSDANNRETTADSYTIRGNYTRVMGHHTVKVGGELNKIGEYLAFLQGYLNYGPDETAQPTASGTTGDADASFLLGLPETVAKRNAVETLRWGGVLGLFAQDQWRATDRLTINAGLRWDHTYMPPFGTKAAGNEDVGNIDFSTGTYELTKLPSSCAVAKTAPCIPTPDGSLPAGVYVSKDGQIWHFGWKEFQPRLGLAYRVATNTVVLAAFGMAFDNYAAVVQTGREIAGLWPSTGSLQVTNLNEVIPGNLYPYVTPQHLPGLSSIPAASPFISPVIGSDPNLRIPYTEQYNFGIQQELSPATVLTLNYVGQSSHQLVYGGTWNVASTPGPGNPMLRRPFPNIAPALYDNNAGNSNYNGLQAQLKRRFDNGLSGSVAYTFSKTIDVGCSGYLGAEACYIQDIYSPASNRGLSSLDLTNILAADFTYETPIGRGKPLSTNNAALDYILGNWQINGLITFNSGSPLTIIVPGDVANIGGNTERPNLIGNPHLSQRTRSEWFNTAAFGQPAPFTFGNVGRNSIRGPAAHEIDMSLFREFPFHDLVKLQLRAEAFNVFNNVVYGNPGNEMGISNFGVITGAAHPRLVQFAAKIIF